MSCSYIADHIGCDPNISRGCRFRRNERTAYTGPQGTLRRLVGLLLEVSGALASEISDIEKIVDKTAFWPRTETMTLRIEGEWI